MSKTPTILVVEDDPDTLRALKSILVREGGYTVETAESVDLGFELAMHIRPDLIISDYSMPGKNGLEFCKAVRAESSLQGTMFVLLTGHAETRLKIEALNEGVDDFMPKPVGMAELLAKARAALRIKKLHDELREDKTELELLHRATAESFEQILDVLAHLIELHSPGTSDRTKRLTDAARELGVRVELDERDLRDLALAARVHEIGKLVAEDPSVRAPLHSMGASHIDRRYVILSSAILERVAQLRKASRIVHALYENYDGTGMPERRRQSEIPFASRVLRVLIDYFAEHDVKGTTAAVEQMQTRSGTLYDPLVVAHLASIATSENAEQWRSSGVRVPIGALRSGMMLAEDLLTDTGLKLVAAGTMITPSVLESVLRRHEREPFVRGAVIRPPNS